MITMSLTDSTGTLELPLLDVPLTEETIENATDVQTLDMNVYTDFINTKRLWRHKWGFLEEADYNALRGYYNRQFTLFAYPTLSISYYGITNVPVRLSMNQKDITDGCGTVDDVEITLRETAQLT